MNAQVREVSTLNEFIAREGPEWFVEALDGCVVYAEEEEDERDVEEEGVEDVYVEEVEDACAEDRGGAAE
jgi:hypothetical protein